MHINLARLGDDVIVLENIAYGLIVHMKMQGCRFQIYQLWDPVSENSSFRLPMPDPVKFFWKEYIYVFALYLLLISHSDMKLTGMNCS